MSDIVGGTAEIWIQLDTPFARYEVSDLGRVRNAVTGYVFKERSIGDYKQVSLRTDDKRRAYPYVHRLVAQVFLDHPSSPNMQVNHINRDPSDNQLDNLEWCTAAENISKRTSTPSSPNNGRSVIQRTIDGSFVAKYDKISNIPFKPDASSISKVCRGKSNSAYGFLWNYADEELSEGEVWKEIDVEGRRVEVSSGGRVRLLYGKITHGTKTKTGYRAICLSIAGKDRTYQVHRLVAMAFCPIPNAYTFENLVVDHLNRDRVDNRADNLEWVTLEENGARANRGISRRSEQLFWQTTSNPRMNFPVFWQLLRQPESIDNV